MKIEQERSQEVGEGGVLPDKKQELYIKICQTCGVCSLSNDMIYQIQLFIKRELSKSGNLGNI